MDIDIFPQIITNINSTNPDLICDAVRSIRKLLSIENNPPIDLVIRSGLVPKLHYLLQFGQPETQYEASWALTNIASGTSEHTRFVVDNGVVHSFIVLLSSDNSQLAEQCLWGIGNIMGDTPALRDYVLSLNITDAILQMVQKQCSTSLLRNVAWTISNMCRGSPAPRFAYIKPLFPVLASFITQPQIPASDDQVIDTLWAFSFITESATNYEEEIFKEFKTLKIIDRLFVFLAGPFTAQVPAFRTLGNMLSGSDHITEYLLERGILTYLISFLGHHKESFVKDAYWCLSNITSGNQQQIQRVVDSGVIPKVYEACFQNQQTVVKTEALWVIINAVTGGNKQQLLYMTSVGLANCLGSVVPFVLEKHTIQVNFFESLLSLFTRVHGPELKKICDTFKAAGWHQHFKVLMAANTDHTMTIEEAESAYLENCSADDASAPAQGPGEDVTVRLSNLFLN